MRIPVVISLTLISLAPLSSLMAQGSGPAVDPQTMLNNLESLKQKQAVTAKFQLNQVLSDFNSAAGSDEAALAFYTQAVQVTRFNGRVDAATEFENWKKNVLPRMNPAAVRTTLRYMAISLQRAAGGTDEQMFPLVLAYAQSVQPNLPSILAPIPVQSIPMNERGTGRHERGQFGQGAMGAGLGGADPGEQIMEQSIAENVFGKWYNLQIPFSNLGAWGDVPGDIDGIYSAFLLPIMRKNRDPRILDYWDTRIELARDAASASAVTFTADTYNSITRPTLVWDRAEDEIVIGQRNQGLTDMYTVIKNFPAHPSAKKWIAELETYLQAAPAVASGGASPATPH